RASRCSFRERAVRHRGEVFGPARPVTSVESLPSRPVQEKKSLHSRRGSPCAYCARPNLPEPVPIVVKARASPQNGCKACAHIFARQRTGIWRGRANKPGENASDKI